MVSSQTAPVAVEQYRRLAATLHQLQTERGLKMLLVTSTVPEEGKTLTVANLALTLSESVQASRPADRCGPAPAIHPRSVRSAEPDGADRRPTGRAEPAPGPRGVAPVERRAGRPSGSEPDGQADLAADEGPAG